MPSYNLRILLFHWTLFMKLNQFHHTVFYSNCFPTGVKITHSLMHIATVSQSFLFFIGTLFNMVIDSSRGSAAAYKPSLEM